MSVLVLLISLIDGNHCCCYNYHILIGGTINWATNELFVLGPPAFQYPTGKKRHPYALASCAAVPGLLTIMVLS